MDSQGMKNAKRMLEKLGWSEGTGLGLNSDGITEAVKPTPKTNLSGIGHKNYSDFQWWDHAFNKAAQAFDVKVTDSQGPVVVKSNKLDKISTKKGHANIKQDELAYGVFHKSGTLHNGIVQDSGNTFTLKEETDYSLKLTDEELFKVCNGLTAHKGARHGLTASGKLARIAQQEAELLAKMNLSSASSKKRKREKTLPSNTESPSDALKDSRLENGSENRSEQKSSKKKRKEKTVESNSAMVSIEDLSGEVRSKIEENCGEEDENASSLLNTKKEKKKKKKDRNTESDSGIHQPVKENSPSPVSQEEVKKKKKKKKDKDSEQEPHQLIIEEEVQESSVEKAERRKKKKAEKIQVELSQSPLESTIIEVVHGKKKKKKKDKRTEGES